MPAASSRTTSGKRSRNADKDVETALQVMVPARIKREVSMRAAEEGTTQRTIILSGLRAIGFKVDDKDLCDKRKSR